MGFAVSSGAMIKCSFGNTSSVLNVLPASRAIQSMPLATIMDNVPMVNIMPFGMCTSLLNPTVSAATSAALGTLTPMPCTPVTLTPWSPGCSTVLIGGKPALHHTCKLNCMYGGVIEIVNPAINNIQFK